MNCRKTLCTLSSLLALVVGTAQAQDASEILEAARDKQEERWAGVNSYSVTKQVAGQTLVEYYQRINVRGDDGEVRAVFQPVAADAFACGAGEAETITAAEMRQRVADSEAAVGGAGMSMADNVFGDGSATPLSSDNFFERAELVGSDTVNGRDAWQLRVTGLNHQQYSDGTNFTLDTYDMWLDKERQIALRGQIAGSAEKSGESRDIRIEIEMSDYRDVPGSSMYEPYSQRMTMVGMIDDAQRAQIKEAQAQLAEFEEQMASMPASQRKMMQSMMGERLEMMRNLASGGDFEMTITVDEIAPNADVTGAACRGS